MASNNEISGSVKNAKENNWDKKRIMAIATDSISASEHIHYIILFEAKPGAFPSIRFLTVTIGFLQGTDLLI
jgi:hypothetical protein